MTGEAKARKSRDPIFSLCLIICFIAVIVVVGAAVKDTYLPSGDETASDGDTVVVNYTGAFYAFSADGGVVFDTSYADVANNDSILKSEDFAKTTFKPLTFKIGSGEVLKAFGDSAIGKKVGDRYAVKIDASDGYVAAVVKGTMLTKGNTIDSSISMAKEKFAAEYPDVKLTVGQMTAFETKFGWTAYATSTDDGKTIQITYAPEIDTYTIYTKGETSVDLVVKSVSNGVITFDLNIINPVKVDGGIQMIKLQFGQKTIYITDVDSSKIYYKEGSEVANEDLYFEIQIVSIN